MGAASSTTSRLQPAVPDGGCTSCADANEPLWPLPPACQDDIWLNVDLPTVLGAGAGIPGGKDAGGVGRGSSERHLDGNNARENHTARLSQMMPGSFGCGDDEDDWLEAALCLSMSSLQRQEMALLVARAKTKLLRTLSFLCCHHDIFCESMMQRIHTLRCVHAAMTRQRSARTQRERVEALKHNGNELASQSDAVVVAGESGGFCEASSDDLLGLQLFFSLLDFVRDPECGQEQLNDFLQQITPVLSELPPLCLAGDHLRVADDSGSNMQPAQQNLTPGVVHSLRGFLVTLALAESGRSDYFQMGDDHTDRHHQNAVSDSPERQRVALSALISLVAARGRASDLLVLVNVLLHMSHRKPHVAVLQSDSDTVCVLEATDVREDHILAECSAKRRPASRVKARTSRQGLPVDDDDEEDEVQESPLLAHPTIAMTVGPADHSCGDIVSDPWETIARVNKTAKLENSKPTESHSIKGRKSKGERVKFATPVDRQPWQKSERSSNQTNVLSPASVLDFANDELDGVESRYILPFLRQLRAATPNGDPRLGKACSLHHREVWTCGQNSYGELGHSDTGTRKVHCLVKMFEGKEVVDIAAGNEHTVVLCRTGEVFTAGYNDNGQCGQGTTQRVGVLTRVPILSGRRAVQVHAYNGCEHTLVVLDDGRVVSFGYNYRGQLGHGNTSSEAVPKPIRGLDGMRVTQVSCSYYHSVIACDNGEVYTFGRNDFGQLGTGDTIDRKLPSLVDSLRGQCITSLACGQYHTVVGTVEVGVLSCGKNDYGQLGIEATEFQKTLVAVKGALDGVRAKHLHCGYYHTIVLAIGGRVLGFGRNDYGQLGLGHITQRVFGPKIIEGAEGKGICRVSAGCYHTVLTGSDGMLYVFGRNHHGQLGTGDTNERHSPFPVDTFLGKRVAKVAAGFYHTIVLTGGGNEGASELDTREAAQSSSPHKMLAHPAMILPQDACNQAAEASAGKLSSGNAAKVFSPEMNSPVYEQGENRQQDASASFRGGDDVGFGNTKETQGMEGEGRGICLSNGRVSGRKAAVAIMAHMDRLAESFTSQNGGTPTFGKARTAVVDEANWPRKVGGEWTDEQNTGKHNVYCVEESPDTFELLATILAFVSEEEQVDDREDEVQFQTYMLVAVLRVLKANLACLLQSPISTGIIAIDRAVARNKPLDSEDVSEFHLDGRLGHHSVLDPLVLDSTNDRPATRVIDDDDTVSGTVDRKGEGGDQEQGQDGKKKHSDDLSGDGAQVERYRNVLCVLQRRLLQLVHAEPPCVAVGAAEPIQREAAAVLIQGLEVFFPSQGQQFNLLSKLINTMAVSDDDEPDISVEGDFDILDRPLRGPLAVRHYILNPLLRRLCDDTLASNLIPYGVDADEGPSVCTMVGVSEPTLQGYRVAAASPRLLEMQVKLLVDTIARGSTCAVYSGESPAEAAQGATFLPRYSEDSPSSILQHNSSATDRSEGFGLEPPGATNATVDGSNNPLCTQHLLVDLVLTLTKHMMHWAAGDHVTVDTNLWQSRVLGVSGFHGCVRGPDGGRGVETTGWLVTRAQELCDRATSVVLDGVERTPSSWYCLIKHAQLVFKYSTAILEVTLEKENPEQEDIGGGAEAGDEKTADRLQDTLVGALLPAIVTGLLPFAHIPAFARRLLKLVTATVGLLDEVCFRCPTTRMADTNFVAARNGHGTGSTNKRKPETLFMRGENGKLGGGGITCRNPNGDQGTAETGGGPKEGCTYEHQALPWLLSLAKTTALLAGRLAATLVVGDCGISPFLESYFRSPTYSSWLESDLFAGGCSPCYEALMLAPLDMACQVVNSGLETAASNKTPMIPRNELAGFLEGVTGGFGKGGRFVSWLRGAFAPSDTAYRVIKNQATAGRDGDALELTERALVAAILTHAGLDGYAALFSAQLEVEGGDSVMKNHRAPPQRFTTLWKCMAEMTGWLWHSRSKLRSADADQSRIDALFEGATDACYILVLFEPVGKVPGASFPSCGHRSSLLVAQLAARRRWRKVAAVIRATLRWRAVVRCKGCKRAAVAVPRFTRAMVARLTDPEDPLEFSGGGDVGRFRASVGCLTVLLVLVLANHQRAVTRASGLQSLYVLANTVRTPSLLADVLLSLPPALQTPRLVDRHVMTHLTGVAPGVTVSVTEAFHALLGKLLQLLEISSRARGGCGEVVSSSSGKGTTDKAQEEGQTNECNRNVAPRCVDARTVLVLLEVWGLTLHSADWEFVESSGVIGVITRAAAQFEAGGHGMTETGSGVNGKGGGDAIRDGKVASRNGRASSLQGGASEQVNRASVTCHQAAWTLFRGLIIQLHGFEPPCISRGGSQPLASILQVFHTELTKSVLIAKSIALITRNGSKHESGRCGRGAQRRDRTPSQAILEFANPLIGGFPDSPPHARATTGSTASGTGGSHKRRCQELISSPRRLMNMEDGLMFSADHVLSNPRGSDFSITFWLLLAQDRTGHHRTVLARGHRSERWPVVLLRNTDNRLEVCFGIPSMGNLCERLTSKEAVQVNRWTHVGLISEHNKLRLYFNGTLDCHRTSTGALRANRHPLYVGKVPDGAMRLDGVRGGIEGSIANLRYFTRALSPIHVRIICDPGPPETAKVEDRHCYHLCACLVVISRSPQCRIHLRHPDWLRLLLQALMYGTFRVQQAVCRLLREIIPHLSPQVMANVVLGTTRSQATLSHDTGFHDPKDEVVLETAFISYLLRLVGASSWHVGAPIPTVGEAAGLPQGNDRKEECELTVAQVLVRDQVMQFLPLTIAPVCARSETGGGGTGGIKGQEGRGVMPNVDATVTAQHSAPPLSAETAHDISTLGAELVAVVQSLAATEKWRVAVAVALRQCLGHLVRFIGAVGDFAFLDDSCERDIDLEQISAEDRLAIAGGEAVLQVLGGTTDFLRAGVCARIRETDLRCTVLGVDQATSMAHVIVHPDRLTALDKWIQRLGAHDIDVQASDSLSRGAMVAFSAQSITGVSDGGSMTGKEYITGLATAFLRSSPLPRPHLTLRVEGVQGMHDAQSTYREIVLAQCRSRLVKAILRASRDDDWAGSAVKDSDLLKELLRVSVVKDTISSAVMREEDLAKIETVAIQNRLRQMLGAPGGGDIVARKIVRMILNPNESTFTRACGGDDGDDDGGRKREREDHRLPTPANRAWVDSLGCPFCHEEKTTVSGIVEHVLTTHSADMRRVPCPVCIAEKGDDTAHDLPTHLELVHFDAVLRDRRPFLLTGGGRRREAGVERLEARPPSDLVEQLMVIGFPEDWCTLALRENDNDVVNASAWIVDNLDMLSSLNNLDASVDGVGDVDVTSPRIRQENGGRPWQGPYRFARERLARREGRVSGGGGDLAEEHQREFGDGIEEEKYGAEDELEANNEEEGNDQEDEEEMEERAGNEEEDEDEEDEDDEEEERGEEEDEEEEEEEEEEEGNDHGGEMEDGHHGGDRLDDEAFDSEEEDEQNEDEAAIGGIDHPQQIDVVPPPRSALDDALDDDQHEMVETHRIGDGLVVSDHRDSYFPLEHAVRTPVSSLHVRDGSSRCSQLASVISEIAGMELCQLTEVWLDTEQFLTALYCRAALVNMLLRWPVQVPMSIASFGSSTTIVNLVQSLLFSGQDLPTTPTGRFHSGVLRPVPNGARPPNVLGVFAPLLVHLLSCESDPRSTDTTTTAAMEKAVDTEADPMVAGDGAKVVATGENCEWRNTLSARLVSACLDELDAAAAAEAFADTPWAAEESTQTQRMADGKPNFNLLQWLLDLLLSANCSDVFTENAFSRLSNCLNKSSVAAKEVAMFALTSIATKWCEHLAANAHQESGDIAENKSTPIGLPSPLAMEETFQRHMVISRVRSALVKRIAVERRPGGLFYTRYTQTLTALYVAMSKLQHLLLCRRQQPGRTEPGDGDIIDDADLSGPTILYSTDSSVALTWLPLHKTVSTSRTMYEVQMATRQLGIVQNQEAFRCVYAGKRLRCRVDDLMPGQVYRFRLRAVHPTGKTTAWSTVATAETEQGIAFRFDSANSGPAIFVSGNELSASFGSNETWSTILGTTPFVTGSNYWELRLDKSATAYLFIGVATRDADLTTFLGGDDNGWGFIGDRALYHKRTKVKAYGERFGQGDTIGVTLNMDRGTLSFSKNGRDLGVAFEGLVGGLYPAVAFYNQGQRLSLVQSAFRCPGAGVAILDSPLSTTPEDVSMVCEVTEAMVSRKALPNGWMEAVRAGHMAWIAGTTARYATALGFELQFDVSDSSCRRFGLKARGRVRTPRGNATVIGICEGVMWFHVDGESGAWFFTAGEIWEGRMAGCFVMSSLDVLGADGKGGWTRWRAFGGGRTEQLGRIQEARENHGMEVEGKASVSGAFAGSEREFATVRECAQWTLEVDGCIVAALCDHADRHQVSVWNLTPAEVLEILTPVRRRLEHLLANSSVSDSELLCRVSVLKHLNHEIIGVLPFADLAEGVQISGQAESRTFCWGGSSGERGLAVGVGDHPTRGLGPLFVCLRRSIFLTTKQKSLSQAVSITTTHAKKAEDEYDYPEDLPQVSVNRLKAAVGQESPDGDARLRTSVFHQLYRELRSVDTSLLRMGYTHPMDDGQQRTFKVKFEGEGVDDYGGPYREVFTQVAAELTSTVPTALTSIAPNSLEEQSDQDECLLPILEPTPSSVSGGDRSVGIEFTVKPNVSDQRYLRSYKFLGQLLGIALRCRVAAPWRLSKVFWKGLVGEKAQEADLAHMDSAAHAFVQSIRKRIAELQQKDQRQDAPRLAIADDHTSAFNETSEGLTWTAPASGKAVELIPGGRGIAVERADLSTYVHEVAQVRLHEGDIALFAVRDGLASVVPPAVLPLFTWEEVELQACGRPGVDVDLLQANTEYDDDISSSDAHIQSFWRVLRAFDNRDRSQFLRFVWARSRLPSRAVDFHQKFKIHSPTGDGARQDPDQYLPKAHTCFFSINLPRYSSDEVMAKKLSYTMYNCIEMDADFRLADNEMSEWGNDAGANNSRGQSRGSGANFADRLA